jgi:hypothetical protein
VVSAQSNVVGSIIKPQFGDVCKIPLVRLGIFMYIPLVRLIWDIFDLLCISHDIFKCHNTIWMYWPFLSFQQLNSGGCTSIADSLILVVRTTSAQHHHRSWLLHGEPPQNYPKMFVGKCQVGLYWKIIPIQHTLKSRKGGERNDRILPTKAARFQPWS